MCDISTITKTQALYLYYIGCADKKEQTVSGLARRLHVSLPSASAMVTGLERLGLVARENKKLKVTSEGRELVAQMREKQRVLRRWMEEHELSPKSHVEIDALHFLLHMSAECVDATLHAVRREETDVLLRDVATTQLGNYLKDGDYEMDFTLYKADGMEISMGNRGFYHPAVLSVFGGKGLVRLKAKTITYIGRGRLSLSGRLSALSYWSGKEFQPIRVPKWYESWQLPLCTPDIRVMGQTLEISQPVMARASCGIANMPESKAILVLQTKFFDK